MKRTSTYPLQVPTSLKAAVAEISRAEGTSMNQFIAMAVVEKISAMRTAGCFVGRGDAADVEVALGILRREGGRPPDDDDVLDFVPSGGSSGVAG